MKDLLIKHIKSIKESLNFNFTFEVYDCKVDKLPDWTEQIKITHEYLVCTKDLSDAQKLHRFTKKNIKSCEQYLYWFEGEEFILVYTAHTPPVPSYISELTLPDWLDSFLFDELGARYAPDYVRYVYNLNLSKEEVKTYLGTYFPRSYTESFCIFDNLISNSKYNQIMQEKSELSILDFGCGTGGEIVGLLTAIGKYLPNINKVNIFAIDGNHDALRHSNKIIDRFKSQCLFSINYNVGPISIIDCSDVEIINEIVHDSFDFIISFKAICELISKQRIEGNAYKFVAETLAPKLTDNGVMLLLDVTVKNDIINTYYPIYLNQGLRTFVNGSDEFKTLIPLSCFLYEDTCSQQCFTQRTFNVTHSRKDRDVSKVAYRILGRSNFVDKIALNDLKGKFIIQRKNGTYIYCPYSEEGNRINSYDINN
jgi:SAM-dependent methyltransferase